MDERAQEIMRLAAAAWITTRMHEDLGVDPPDPESLRSAQQPAQAVVGVLVSHQHNQITGRHVYCSTEDTAREQRPEVRFAFPLFEARML